MQRAYNKYGSSVFRYDIVEIVEDLSMLLLREQHWIDAENPFYNICRDARSRLGCKHTEDTKLRVGLASKERNQGENHPWFGRKHSDESRKLISERRIGKTLSKENIAKREETRRRNREIMKLKGIPDVRTGRLISEKHRKNLNPARGENHPRAKLTFETVVEIKKRLLTGESQQSIADDVGIAQTGISGIKRNKKWMHVPWPKEMSHG